MINRAKSGTIDMEVDELTPCLKRLSTGAIVQTRVEQINPKKHDLDGFHFDWVKPLKDGHGIHALYAEGDARIQGLLASARPGTDGGVWIELVESANFNSGFYNQAEREYSGVGGHLFAEAIRQARRSDANGYVYFQAKSQLISYYEKAFGAVLINGRRGIMGIFDDAATKLYDTYYGGGGF